MKKLAAAAGATILSLGGGIAFADDVTYPPADDLVVLSPAVVGPGDPFTATLTDCEVGETVNFTVEGDSDSDTCDATGGGASRAPSIVPGGTASVTMTAPSVPGEYPVTGTGATSGISGTAILTVVAAAPGDGDGDGAGELPATGSDSGATMQIAGGALIAGLALVGVAYMRRRPQLS